MDPLKTEDTDVGGWTAERHVTALYQAHALSLARLALVMLGDRSAETVRMLHVTADGSDLIKDSRVIWSTSSSSGDNYPSGCKWDQDPLVSADGKTVVCVSVTGTPTRQQKTIPWRLSWLEYSTSDPKAPSRTLYSVTINASDALNFQLFGLWTNASGSSVIGYRSNGRFTVAKPAFFGVISKGALRSLPTPGAQSACSPVDSGWVEVRTGVVAGRRQPTQWGRNDGLPRWRFRWLPLGCCTPGRWGPPSAAAWSRSGMRCSGIRPAGRGRPPGARWRPS